MANRNTKRKNKLARKARAASQWARRLIKAEGDIHRHTIKGK